MKYQVSGGDDEAYGPIFGPVITEEVGEIPFLADGRYLLLRALTPFVVEKDEIQYILISPRYEGDTIETVKTGECIVGIGVVLPNTEIDITKGLTQDRVKYFAVGQCKKIEG